MDTQYFVCTGIEPEDRGLYNKMKVGELLLFLAELKGIKRSEAKKKIDFWLERFDLANWKLKKVEALSRGMQQKIQFIVTAIHQPELIQDTKSLDLKFWMGKQVGETARSLYPNGKLIAPADDLSLALDETRYLLSISPDIPLFEAAFEHNGVLIKTDIISRTKKGFRISEVKSSTSQKDYYLFDCAIQFWVVNQIGYPLDHIEIAYINNDFVYQ